MNTSSSLIKCQCVANNIMGCEVARRPDYVTSVASEMSIICIPYTHSIFIGILKLIIMVKIKRVSLAKCKVLTEKNMH